MHRFDVGDDDASHDDHDVCRLPGVTSIDYPSELSAVFKRRQHPSQGYFDSPIYGGS